MIQENGLYTGTIYHERHQPFTHRLRYPVFSMWCDLNDLTTLARWNNFFSYNRWNAMAFYDRDHGSRDGSSVTEWVKDRVAQKAPEIDINRIIFLGFPRMFGYVFNPISIFFCFDTAQELQAIIYEVKNTFGEQHAYVALASAENGKVVPHGCDKVFHVSPFLPMDCRYEFRVHIPNDKLNIAIHQFNDEGKILTATWNGVWRPFTSNVIAKTLLSQPIMSFLVIITIHWEALKLWIKGATYFKKPQPPEKDFS